MSLRKWAAALNSAPETHGHNTVSADKPTSPDRATQAPLAPRPLDRVSRPNRRFINRANGKPSGREMHADSSKRAGRAGRGCTKHQLFVRHHTSSGRLTNDSFRLLYPTLYLLLNLRPKSQRHDAEPEGRENEKPGNDGSKIILPRLVFAHKRPNDDHDGADTRQGRDEQRKHPKSE